MSRRHQSSYPISTDFASISGVEADEQRPLPKEGYAHFSVHVPVSLVQQDAPEAGVKPVDFGDRWAQHRLNMTLRLFGKWLTENVGPEAVHNEILRDQSYSAYGRPIEYQGIARVRHNVSIPQATTLGELVGDAG